MADVIHADIFFFISSGATIILTILLVIVFHYMIRILRDVREVTKRIKDASVDLEQDFNRLRHSVEGEGVRVKTIVELILSFIAHQIPRLRVKRKSKDSSEE